MGGTEVRPLDLEGELGVLPLPEGNSYKGQVVVATLKREKVKPLQELGGKAEYSVQARAARSATPLLHTFPHHMPALVLQCSKVYGFGVKEVLFPASPLPSLLQIPDRPIFS